MNKQFLAIVAIVLVVGASMQGATVREQGIKWAESFIANPAKTEQKVHDMIKNSLDNQRKLQNIVDILKVTKVVVKSDSSASAAVAAVDRVLNYAQGMASSDISELDAGF